MPVFAEFRGDHGPVLAIGSTATVAMLGDRAPRPGSNDSVLVEFEVDDVDAEFARLRDVLDDVVLEPTTMPWGNRSTLFRDPRRHRRQPVQPTDRGLTGRPGITPPRSAGTWRCPWTRR